MKILKNFWIVVVFLGILVYPHTISSCEKLEFKEVVENTIKNKQDVKKPLAQQISIEKTILNKLQKASLIEPKIKELGIQEREDVLCLAMNIYGEARGSSVEDQIATSYVVFNRVNSSEYPLTLKKSKPNLCNIIFDKHQFCWTDGQIKLPSEKQAWKKSQELAYKLYTNKIHQKLAQEFQLKHYVATYMLEDGYPRPSWIEKRQMTVMIGKHSYMSIKENIENTKENQLKALNAIHKGLELLTK